MATCSWQTGFQTGWTFSGVPAPACGATAEWELSVNYDIAFGSHQWALEAGVYNLTNRNNPWYSDLVLTVNEAMPQRRLESVQVVFYDLKFQPSFSLRYYLDP